MLNCFLRFDLVLFDAYLEAVGRALCTAEEHLHAVLLLPQSLLPAHSGT
jgi:hypothetical protein